jgi:TonB family protein
MGVNFEPYLLKCLERVRKNWYALIPQEARDPMKKRGDVGVQFAVMKDGKLTDLKVATTSDDAMLDRAAVGSIAASAPFDPLPKEFRGDRLGLSLHFHYNPEKPPSR